MIQKTGSSSTFKTVIGVLLIVYAIFRIVTLMIELPTLLKLEPTVLLAYGLPPALIAFVCLWLGGRMLWPLLRFSEKARNNQ